LLVNDVGVVTDVWVASSSQIRKLKVLTALEKKIAGG